ncbi:HAD family hydrolase [Actinospongicola halichondriae]|uniref:HAD family hydrolase n=1 Tax=Actinospongicola halichondriae TaxID=3236844 RepID=UPI003D537494
MGRLAGLLFDFDGLVLDTETSEYLTVAESFADHGLELSRDEWVSIIGTADHPHWTQMLETALGRPLTNPEEVLETRRARHHARISKEAIRPGVVELATEARDSGVGVAVASSSPLDWVLGHLTRLGIDHLFPVRATRDDVGHARTKPHPDLFLLAAERLEVDPRDCVVLEDSEPGVTAANAAGCTTVGVPAGMTAHLPFGHADLVVPSLAEVTLADLVALLPS